MVHPYLWITVVGGMVCFLVACGNGANDLSNAFGTSYGSRVLTLLQIIILATGCEFAGAAGLGSSVTKTMSSGIAKPETFANEPYVLMYGFLCALAGTAIWLILATWKDLTVSSHQSIAGGIIGFALVYGGKDAVIWAGRSPQFPFVSGVVPIILSWIISPLLAGSVAALIYAAIRYPLLNRTYAIRVAPLAFPLIACVTAFLEFLFIFFIAAESKLNWTAGHAAWVAAVIAAGIGVVCIPLVPLMKRQIAKMERQAQINATERHIHVIVAMREILAGGRPLTRVNNRDNDNDDINSTTTTNTTNNDNNKKGDAKRKRKPHTKLTKPNTKENTINDEHEMTTYDNIRDINNTTTTVNSNIHSREERNGRESDYYEYSPREGTLTNNGIVNTNATTSGPVEVRRVRKHDALQNGNSVNDGVKSLDVPSAAEGAVVRVENSSSSSDDENENEQNNCNGVNTIINTTSSSTEPHHMDHHASSFPSPSNTTSHPHDRYTDNIDNNVASHEENEGRVNIENAEVDVYTDEDGVKLYDPRAEYIFRSLQIFTAACMSLAHGANDVSNSIGPFSAIYGIYTHGKVEATAVVPIWLLCLGGAGIVVGLATYGVNIMRLLGEKLAVITPARGFSAELSTALVVSFATMFGIPISSTHCITGAVIGISIMDVGIRHVRWRIIGRMYVGWMSTLIITGVISAAFFSQGVYSPKA